jgi:hypothetical protein
MNVEEEYLDVLQNIEYAIVEAYRQDKALTDATVLFAIETLIREYSAEARGKQAAVRPLTGLGKEVGEAVKNMCDWRLGRSKMTNERGQALEISPITLDALIACLKRIRKSIEFWTKEGGRQGYLNYINRFL